MDDNWNENGKNEEILENRKRKKEQQAARMRMRRRKKIIQYAMLGGITLCLLLLVFFVGKWIFSSNDAGTSVASGEGEGSVTGTEYELGVEWKTLFSNEPTGAEEPPKEQIPEKGLIVLDPGHGGGDGGSSGIDGILEKDLNLEIGLKLKDKLIEEGYSVFMTREDDTFIGLSARPKLANEQNNPILYLSIHMNAIDMKTGDTSPNGVEIICYERDGSIELADALLEQIVAKTEARKRKVIYSSQMAVTRLAEMPACLIECGFITNPEENQDLQDSTYQEKLVDGIFNGVEVFLADQSQKEDTQTSLAE